MVSQRQAIRKEMRAICRFRARRHARFALIIILILMIPLDYAIFYLTGAILFFPWALDIAIQSASPGKNEQLRKRACLKETMDEYHFTYTQHRAESITSVLILLFLAAWQLISPRNIWHGISLGRLPLLVFALYYLTSTCLFFFYHFKMKRDFEEINIH